MHVASEKINAVMQGSCNSPTAIYAASDQLVLVLVDRCKQSETWRAMYVALFHLNCIHTADQMDRTTA